MGAKKHDERHIALARYACMCQCIEEPAEPSAVTHVPTSRPRATALWGGLLFYSRAFGLVSVVLGFLIIRGRGPGVAAPRALWLKQIGAVSAACLPPGCLSHCLRGPCCVNAISKDFTEDGVVREIARSRDQSRGGRSGGTPCAISP